jgi:hypothetical protein
MQILSYSFKFSRPQMVTRDAVVRLQAESMMDVLPKKPTREQIEKFESGLLQLEQTITPTKHYFAPGLYVREMFIPKGTFLTGDVHKTDHMCVFVGDIHVWVEGEMKRLTGHHTFLSKAGAKRVGYAFEDTYCTGFFPTDKTDIAELERDLCENPEKLQCNRFALTKSNNQAIEE